MRLISRVSVLSCIALGACKDSTAPSSSSRLLAFVVQPPSRTAPGVVLAPAPQVEVRFLSGERDTSADVDLSLVLGPGHPRARLLGTTTVRAVAGVAVFDDLSIDSSGSVALYASGVGGLKGSSELFRVVVPFSSLSSSVFQSCATTPNGDAYCWGENSQQQLGVGAASPQLFPARVQAAAGIAFTAIGVGRVHACALTSVGSLYCWGLSDGSALGDGTGENRTAPALVHTPAGLTFTALSVGHYHACAIASNGTTYCWGANYYGELGDGTGHTPLEPVAVAAPAGVSFTQVSPGLWHTCAVTGLGAAYCWGAKDYGDLGDGTGDSSWIPIAVKAPAGVSFASVSAGTMHSCGLTPAGAAYCWGRNDGGGLGDGSTTASAIPVPVQMPSGVGFKAISAGQFRTCAISATGAAYCWGGDGTTKPTLLTLADPRPMESISLSLGGEACMLSTIGLAYCWGANDFGQIGDGTQQPRSTPVAVSH